MRIQWSAATLLAASCIWGQEAPTNSWTVRAYIQRTSLSNPFVLERAQFLASRILAEADVHLEWRRPGAQDIGSVIGIWLDAGKPSTFHPGALAYAAPFAGGGRQIHILYDRVLAAYSASATPDVLAHVLAHEIGHILIGTDGHASSGVMKARWDSHDYFEMVHHPLRFTEGDIALIHASCRR
jgi:hypothetical protein